MNRFSILLILAVVFSLAACFKDQSEPQPCVYDPCASKASDTAAVRAYLDSAGITGTTQHCSGLFYKIVAVGTGKSPDPCANNIIARYNGTLTNGNVFDSGQFQQPVPLNRLISGWVRGLPLIKEGGRIMLYVPPSLGYGDKAQYDPTTGALRIPANSITIFDVELLTVY